MVVTESREVTVVHVSSESSDHYLVVLPGQPTGNELKAMVDEELDFEEPDCLYIQECEVIRFIG